MQKTKKTSLLLHTIDAGLKEQLSQIKGIQPYQLVVAVAGETWLDTAARQDPNVAIIQADHVTESDFKQLTEKNVFANTVFIFISTTPSNKWIDKLMHQGASYHLRAPLDFQYLSELLAEIATELQPKKLAIEQAAINNLDQFGLLLGSAPIMRRLYRVIRKAATSSSNVLLVGESGVGKELVAKSLHSLSARSKEPFVAVNCGALSQELIESELFGHNKGSFTGADRAREGLFAQAEGGTLFLDEVTEMPLEQQVKLLRVLETGEYKPIGSDTTKTANVRVIAATNRDPAQAVSNQTFRHDLFFRIAHFPVTVPPLRERGTDIIGLAQYFLYRQCVESGIVKAFTPHALEKLNEYRWPGNVRELKYIVECAYILAQDTITVDDLLLGFQAEAEPAMDVVVPPGMELKELERVVILKALRDTEGNKKACAGQLGISVKTLYNKLEHYNNA